MSTAVERPQPGVGAKAGMPAAAPAISLTHVSKTFKLPHERIHTLKESVLKAFRPKRHDVLEAVKDMTLEIPQGQFFGIVGRNGSGKSTLLKCLAGIYDIDQGNIAIHGRLSPFIELGVGFNLDLTARDNLIINAIMLGLSRKEALARYDQIVAFAELEQFMELKLKNYSSGMLVRLAFSVAIQVDAEIVLIDEVLAVGDAGFQQKCYDEFSRMKSDGRTIVFVTHDMGAVEHFCDRAMLVEKGQIVTIGDPTTVAREYNRLNFRTLRQEAIESNGPEVLRRAPVAELLSATFESPEGEPLAAMEQGQPLVVNLETRFLARAENPIFAAALRDDRNQLAFASSTQLDYGATGVFEAGETAIVQIRFDNWLAPGRYNLEASVTPDGLGANAYDLREAMSSIIVHATTPGGGVVDLPHTIELRRS